MPLEVADFIKALVQTNPPGTDPKSSADDHLRLIKHVLQSQFSGFTDGVAISRKESEINAGYNYNPPVLDLNDPAYRPVVNRSWVSPSFANGPPGETAGTTNAQVTWTPGAGDGSYGRQEFMSGNRALCWRRYYLGNGWSNWYRVAGVVSNMSGPGYFQCEDFMAVWGATGNISAGQQATYTFARQFVQQIAAFATPLWTQPAGKVGILSVAGVTTSNITLFAQCNDGTLVVSGTYLVIGKVSI